MEVHFPPDIEAKLAQLATTTGRQADQLVQEVMSSYLEEVAQTREMLDSRYDDIKSSRMKPIDGEAFFESLR
jgi:predicted DNA-binding protein